MIPISKDTYFTRLSSLREFTFLHCDILNATRFACHDCVCVFYHYLLLDVYLWLYLTQLFQSFPCTYMKLTSCLFLSVQMPIQLQYFVFSESWLNSGRERHVYVVLERCLWVRSKEVQSPLILCATLLWWRSWRTIEGSTIILLVSKSHHNLLHIIVCLHERST